LALILGGGKVWTHATNKYVRDIRRRRQILIVRRVVVGFLSAIVILFGFVTQFDSLATFAGFITAGIAVGLQTILLSVAAYFFIIGRYGVKVGDRITISSVTGDVIDVGLVRFYVMELAGSGTELNPTGRVAVFSNAVLFQAGTPLYKQMPGTEYAWHELIVKLADTANYKIVCEAILKELHAVYDGYRTNIERQHEGVQKWMKAAIDPPAIESRLQLNGGAFQLCARFPVQIKQASETDEKLTRALLELMERRPEIKNAVASTPFIQASVRG
jgi:small-conductance mechanosensitive channel